MEKGSAQDSVNGLKLYFQDMGSGVQAKTGGGSSPVVASGGPLPVQVKRGRGSGVQPPRCQVEGCELDLSDCKAYYSRHKVCGMHSKSRKVIVAGLEQRFCQQCSRFHQLSEFDQGKRSCRRRLAGHNERRRKPAPALSTHYGNGSSSVFETHGRNRSFVMDFSLYPSLTGSSSERGLGSINRKVLPSPWHGNNLLQGSTTSASYVGGRASSSSGCFSGILDSSSALSLLSNHQPWGSLGLNTSYGPNGTSMAVHPSAAHDAHLANFLSHPWDFKDNQASTSSHHMPPDLCLGQISHRHYSNELEMAQQGGGQFHELELSTGHTSSVDHMHWSL